MEAINAYVQNIVQRRIRTALQEENQQPINITDDLFNAYEISYIENMGQHKISYSKTKQIIQA
jgi:hypothetical protein